MDLGDVDPIDRTQWYAQVTISVPTRDELSAQAKLLAEIDRLMAGRWSAPQVPSFSPFVLALVAGVLGVGA